MGSKRSNANSKQTAGRSAGRRSTMSPTHSYMKYLYKYPQTAYPYSDLVDTSRRRGRQELEYELLDTGVFDQDRYFDIFVEYAKASPEDILIEITVCNR